MKKIIRFMTVLVAVFFIGLKGVKADGITVNQSFFDNVWSFHYRNGSVYTYGQLPLNTINNRLVYCIQPDARITSSNYSVYTDFTMSGYTEEEKRRMELIAYYGYGYNDHKTDKYYMATQELLWLMTNDESIKWTVGDTDDTEQIDVSAEKNEINRLISMHNVLPSFVDNAYLDLVMGKELELIDENNVLDNYIVTPFSGLKVRTEGNKLYVSADKTGTYPINFTPKYTNYYGSDKTYIYDDFSTRTQTLASFTKPSITNGNIIINIKVNVDITKKDKDTDEIINDEGIKIKIKNEDLDEDIDEYEFTDGKININLPVGNYSIEEISTSKPYLLNNEKLLFSITNNDKDKSIDFYNEKIKCLITYITTSGEEKIDVEFNVYDKNNVLVYSGKTINGIASIELTYGDYVIKEIGVPNGYILNNKEISFTVDDKTCKSSLSVDNEKVTVPITSTESNIGYLFILLSNIGGYVFIKKNS